jgi:DNA-binding transcriptional LysR family regulator
VHEGVCDFAVLHLHSELAGEELIIERLGSEEFIIVASNDDPRIGATIDIAELMSIPFVASPVGQIRELEDIALRKWGVTKRQIAIELGHPEAIKQAVRQQLGIGLLFRSAVEEPLADGTLRAVALRGAPMLVPLVLVHSRSKIFSPLQKKVIGHIREELANMGCT